jgi:hypothetical protein
MIKRNWLSLAVIVVLSASHLYAEDKVLFEDNFDRADSEKIDNGWTVNAENDAKALLKDKAAFFETTDEEYQPSMAHKFEEQTKGQFTVSFVMDWIRDYETDWGFYMQLGSSKTMEMAKVENQNKGVAVNLVWGGGFSINSEDISILANVKGEKVNKLTELNNSEEEKTVVKNTVIKIDVDMNSKTYAVTVNGKEYKKLAFDNDNPIDTIRFIAHNVNPSNFPKKSIDNVKITKKK